MDTGFTEHSGCPVFVGSKKIVTQWIRLGVDHDNPWDSFNTLGVKKSDLAEYEDTSAEQPADQGDEPEGGDMDEDEDFDDGEDFYDEADEDSAHGGEGNEL
jgi:hypothetical protein